MDMNKLISAITILAVTLISLIMSLRVPHLKGYNLLKSSNRNELVEVYISRQRSMLESLYNSTGGDTYWDKDVADTWMSSDDICIWK